MLEWGSEGLGTYKVVQGFFSKPFWRKLFVS